MSPTKPPAVTRRTLGALVATLVVASACGNADGEFDRRDRKEREPRENENERDENERDENERDENERDENERGGGENEGDENEGGGGDGSGVGRCVENPGECEPGS